MSAKTIAILNNKGGVGKTTLTYLLAWGLHQHKHNVCVVDIDSQSNLTSALYHNPMPLAGTIETALLNGIGLADVAQHIATDNNAYLTLIPASRELLKAELQLSALQLAFNRMREKLAPLQAVYDYILIDCPPNLGYLTQITCLACNGLIVPMQPGVFDMEGLINIERLVDTVRQAGNTTFQLYGIVFNGYNPALRGRLYHNIYDSVYNHAGNKVFRCIIPNSIRYREMVALPDNPFASFLDRYPSEKQKIIDLIKEFIEKTSG